MSCCSTGISIAGGVVSTAGGVAGRDRVGSDNGGENGTPMP